MSALRNPPGVFSTRSSSRRARSSEFVGVIQVCNRLNKLSTSGNDGINFEAEDEMRIVFPGLAVLCLLATAGPVAAHHSFGAEYDANKPITLTGVVTKVEWMNPHSYFWIDAVGTL